MDENKLQSTIGEYYIRYNTEEGRVAALKLLEGYETDEVTNMIYAKNIPENLADDLEKLWAIGYCGENYSGYEYEWYPEKAEVDLPRILEYTRNFEVREHEGEIIVIWREKEKKEYLDLPGEVYATFVNVEGIMR